MYNSKDKTKPKGLRPHVPRALFVGLSSSLLLAACSSSAPEDTANTGEGTGDSDSSDSYTGGDSSVATISGDSLSSGGASITPGAGGALTQSGGAPGAGGLSSSGGFTASGGSTNTGGGISTGGVANTGGASSGGASSTGGAEGTGGGPSGSRCDAGGLVWKSARKTNYTSYPDPGSEECVKYNGCMWAGWFAGCDNKQSEAWVEAHNIAAVFPGYGALDGHELCIRSGSTEMIIHVVDTCGDDDCDGCCTQNQGSNDALIDLESFTNARWGLQDGIIQWADLGIAM